MGDPVEDSGVRMISVRVSRLRGRIKTVTSAARARHEAVRNRSVRAVREDFEPLSNAAIASAVGLITAS